MISHLEIILNLLFPFLQLLILQKYKIIILGEGERKFINYFKWILYYTFLSLSVIGIILPPHVQLLGNILFIFIISTTVRKTNLMQRCIFTIIISAIWMMLEVIVMMLLTVANIDENTLQIAGSFLSQLCMILLYVIINKFINHTFYSEIPLPYFLSILIIPVSSIFIIHNLFLISGKHNNYAIFSASASFLLIISNYVIFEIYDWICKNAELREQNRLYSQQLDLCTHQAVERETFYFEIRKFRHDIKGYLISLLGMIQANKVNDAEKYISNLLDISMDNQADGILHSGNIVIDSLVNYSFILAKKKGIALNADVLVPSSLPFESGHLAIIIGNLIDNAMEACSEVSDEDPYIDLNLSYSKNVLQLNMKNNYEKKLRKNRNGKYLTTKRDNYYHGLGLSSVQHAVSHYNGQMEITDNNNTFQVTIVMFGI
ncbi:MAG: GHKL domain-containing protein [Lachnospiraceae bacterium]|nr:GHKL domain-containing protein [Lachnospiraceae bacterium]